MTRPRLVAPGVFPLAVYPAAWRAVLAVTGILFIEGAGVVLGYALLGDLLGIFRHDAPPELSSPLE